jgi:adenosine deaminase
MQLFHLHLNFSLAPAHVLSRMERMPIIMMPLESHFLWFSLDFLKKILWLVQFGILNKYQNQVNLFGTHIPTQCQGCKS